MGVGLVRISSFSGTLSFPYPHGRLAMAAKKKKSKKAKKSTAKRRAAKKPAKKKTAAKRKPNPAFMKAMTPSAALAEVVGSKPLPRTEVTSKLWAYIKRKGLQDKVNRRNIHADDALRPIFKKDVVNMFEMTRLVSKHLS
jgi:upstream activation factor subunit UAF30